MFKIAKTSRAMQKIGERLAHVCEFGVVIYLCGELGVGKTTFVRGFLRGFGYAGYVRSPTFTLVEPYQINSYLIYHFDLYRMNSPEELEYIGIRDYFTSASICLIEWPERGGGFLPEADLICKFDFQNKRARKIEFVGVSQKGKIIESRL